MKKIGTYLLTIALGTFAACSGSTKNGTNADGAAGSMGTNDAAGSDATGTHDGAGSDDAVIGNHDTAGLTDASQVDTQAADTGPAMAACADLPITLTGKSDFGVYDFGTLCYSSAVSECRVTGMNLATCTGNQRALIYANAGGGEIDFNFGFPTTITATSAGTVQQSSVVLVPIPGMVTIDVKPMAGPTMRLVLNYTSISMVTVVSFAPM